MLKSLKTILSIVLCAAMLVSGLTVISFAADETVVIENSELKQYSGSDRVYEIPSDVKNIGENAFSDCPELEEIYIGSNVESIGSKAFAGCDNLKIICIAGTKDIVINSDIADKSVLILVDNDAKSTRKSIATNGYNWASYTVYTVSGKKVFALMYGADESACGYSVTGKVIDAASPDYVYISDSGKYYLASSRSASEINFGSSSNPGLSVKLNMALKTWKLPDKSDINSGNDGAKNGIARLLNSLFRAFR